MDDKFDPYRKWLAIPADQRPATHYQLLGIPPAERDAEVINSALLQRSAFVRNYQSGKYSEHATKILNELSAAVECLCNNARRAEYDKSLKPAAPRRATPAAMPPAAPPNMAAPSLAQFGLGQPLDSLMSLGQPDLSAASPQVAPWMSVQPRSKRSKGVPVWVLAAAVGGAVMLVLLIVGVISMFGGGSDDAPGEGGSEVIAGQNNDDPPKLPTDPPKPPPAPIAAQPIPAGQWSGQEWEANGLKMTFCWCPAGSFKMGSPDSDEDNQGDEKQVGVTLTSGYWLGKCEVKQGEWGRVMGTRPLIDGETIKEGSDYAVSNVSWEDAVRFCELLSNSEQQAGRLSKTAKYRLPTEAEWEYACRAGTTTRYSFGDEKDRLSEFGWWGASVDEGNSGDEQYVHEVGLKSPNPWGFHDMHGNAFEWCSDKYAKQLIGGRDPKGSGIDWFHVYKGGGWNSNAAYCRSAFRFSYSPIVRYSDLGFRIAISPTSK